MPIGMSDAETIKSLLHRCAQSDVDRAVRAPPRRHETGSYLLDAVEIGHHAAGRLDL
jgi:hypothetical protein